jgi:N-acetylmuramoyl-L-alanine amidase
VKDRQIELHPDSQAYLAAEAALEGADPTNGAIFYYNPKISNDRWIKTRSVVCSIGNHKFCV